MAEDIVTVGTYDNPSEADMAKFMLQNEGITVFLDNREVIQANWFLSNAVGNIRLQVPGDQAERAVELLESYTRHWPKLASNNAMDHSDLSCMSCGEHIPDDQDACPACGWSYADEEA